jgi:GH24 family phage-related lysozyme (muramidase)
MIDKKELETNRKYLENNWYKISQENDFLSQEASIKDNFRNMSYAVALMIAGLSVHEISQRYNVPKDIIEEASQNPNIREEAEKLLMRENLPETTLSVPVSNIPADSKMSTSSYDVTQTKKDVIFYETDGMTEDMRYVYYDSKKIPTIGIGINLQDSVQQKRLQSLGYDINQLLNKQQGLSQKHIYQIFDESYQQAEKDAITYFPQFNQLHPTAQSILVDMSYNMGLSKLQGTKKIPGFTKMNAELLKAIQTGDYSKVADEMENSGWFRQTGRRGKTQSNRMRNIK